MEQTQIDGVNGWNRCRFSGIALYIGFESHEALIQLFHGPCQMWYYSFKYSIFAACYYIQNDWVEYLQQRIFVEPGWLWNNDSFVSSAGSVVVQKDDWSYQVWRYEMA